jgi:hypothetical protein
VAYLIEINALCQTYNALPRPGGILDQPALLMRGLLMVAAAQQEKAELEQQRSEQRAARSSSSRT